jgi:bacteriocin-like protein
MARIQITDLTPSDSELMDELTDEKLAKINGGSFWRDLNRAFNRALNSGSVGGYGWPTTMGGIGIRFW